MKKLILVLAIALIATPAFGELAVTLNKRAGQEIVDVCYSGADVDNLPRAFALDVNIGDKAKFTAIGDYKIGESNEFIKGYGIYPARITFYTKADELLDPHHREGNVSSWGSPLAAQGDIGAADQNLADGSKHVILEFASLYRNREPPAEPNNPLPQGRLCSLTVDCNGGANTGIAAKEEDTYRGGIVLEDGTAIDLAITTLRWSCLSPPGKATTPISPTDTATCISLNPTLTWTAGAGATSHDVYIGTVNPPGVPEFKGNQPGASYGAGPLVNNKIYYWRIDEKNDAGTTTGDVWSFTTLPTAPTKATTPISPTQGATCVSLNPTLTWTAGSGTGVTHDVYFGTVNPPGVPEFKVNQAGTSYVPTGPLVNNKTYYWRIDEKDTCGSITTGDVWSFTTLPTAPTKATTPISPTQGQIAVSRTATLSWTAGSGTGVTHDIYFGRVNPPGVAQFKANQSGTTYDPCTGNFLQSKTYYWRIDEKDTCGSITTGDVWNFTVEECLKSTATYYTIWTGQGGKPWSKPDCWCYRRNCRGDADGAKGLNLYWVYSQDLTLLKDAYMKQDPQMTGNRICADFMRDKGLNLYRVYTTDLARLKAYYMKAESLVKCCDADENCTLAAGDVFNFWMN